jgi:hypothetical protein
MFVARFPETARRKTDVEATYAKPHIRQSCIACHGTRHKCSPCAPHARAVFGEFTRKTRFDDDRGTGADLDGGSTSGMGYLRSIAAARQRVISKLFAVCLITLIVTPFTAPFAVCDTADLTQSAAAHGHAFDDGKTAGEHIDRVAFLAGFSTALQAGGELFRPATLARLELLSPLACVLRI